MKKTKLFGKPVILFLMTLLMLSFSKVPSANASKLIREPIVDMSKRILRDLIGNVAPNNPLEIEFWIVLGILFSAAGLAWLFSIWKTY